MAEDTVSRKTMAIPKDEFSRREFLRKAGKVVKGVAAVGATAGVVGVAGLAVRGIKDSLDQIGQLEQSNVEASRFEVKRVLEDKVEITKGFELYSLPVVLEAGHPDAGKYLINPSEIIRINGKDIRGAEGFSLRDSLAVEAQDPNEPSGKKAPWIRVRVERNVGGTPIETYGFISLTYQPRPETVKRKYDKGFVDVENKNGVFVTKDGRQFTNQNTGIVTLNSSK